MKKILIVEDESAIADTLIYILEAEGFEVSWVMLGSVAIDFIAKRDFDLVILDVGLPDMNGFEVCKIIRLTNQLPIIFLTARGEEIDRIVGLEIGGDDYVTKPFSPREVAARVKTILKRVTPAISNDVDPTILRRAPSGCDFILMGQALALTAIEFKLLNHLYSQPHLVFSREQLLQACGQFCDIGYERNIDTHIKTIRNKIKKHDATLQVIKTHRGFGYGFGLKQ